MKQNNNTQQRVSRPSDWDNSKSHTHYAAVHNDIYPLDPSKHLILYKGRWRPVETDNLKISTWVNWSGGTQFFEIKEFDNPEQPAPISKGEGDKVMTKDDWVKAYRDCSDLFLLTVKEAANFKKERDELSNVLKEIVKDWVGEGNFRDIPVLKTQNDTSAGEFKYWTPAAKMVKSELIDKAIEVLKKANPDYNP